MLWAVVIVAVVLEAVNTDCLSYSNSGRVLKILIETKSDGEMFIR